ncbi:hypothetical protein LSAT2_010910 [Lamellibrachia satsuma]|nr:hypothetical protein LSAT2_010910 [Lamellibrachia satsuma]
MSTCLMFVFGALIEFSIVNVIRRESMLVEKTDDIRHEVLEGDEEFETAVPDIHLKMNPSTANYHRPSFVIEQPLIDINLPDLEFVETNEESNKAYTTCIPLSPSVCRNRQT